MTSLTGSFRVIQSGQSTRQRRTDTGTGAEERTSHLLTADATELSFSLSFWNGDRLKVVLIGSGREPSWIWRVISDIQHIAKLDPNWDSYGAAPLSLRAARRCIEELLEILPANTPQPTLVPTRDGGLQLEWHRGGIELEIEVPPVGPVTYLFLDETGEEQEWEGAPPIHAAAIERAINRLMSAG